MTDSKRYTHINPTASPSSDRRSYFIKTLIVLYTDSFKVVMVLLVVTARRWLAG